MPSRRSGRRRDRVPVVLKIESPDLPHKTEVEGVRVGLADAVAVETAFDAIMSAARRHARRHGSWVYSCRR